jgi:FlaA1/EpsC-like NDP-sugar epimerase
MNIKFIRTISWDRFLFFLVSDVILIAISLFLSFVFHFDFDMNVPYLSLMLGVLPFFIVIKLICFGIFRIYRMTWRYVGIFDLVNIVGALIISAMALIILTLPASFIPSNLTITGFPKRIILEDSIISIFLIAGLRISKRIFLEVARKKRPLKKGNRTLVVGAGNTGEMIIRDMARHDYEQFYPIGFLDDDRTKSGTHIHGVKVLGEIDSLEEVIADNNIDSVVVAIPSLNHKMLKGIYESARKLKVKNIKIVPRIYDFDKPDINLKGLEDISIEDLVGRQSVIVDYKSIKGFIKDRKVMVTGAGGSIGAEIVSQACAFHPADLILFDIDETELHNLGLKLNRLFPHLSGQIEYVTGDVRDEMRLQEVFEAYRPQIVFHAAAYKHVPMMEYNPKEAVKVNIIGTFNLAKAAVEHGVEKFIMISTDKAVRPTSIMGATKRMAEYVCKAMGNLGFRIEDLGLKSEERGNIGFRIEELGFKNTKEKSMPITNSPSPVTSYQLPVTRFISVRFGNVLGSRGSVLPLFLEQLKHGGPLTVTHKDMKRYFMTIPEAVSLVLQASTMGEGGEVFVLDMGEPVMITDIAEELIRLHGLEPYKDIDIEFTGLRPGEKLFEEILTAEEGTVASKHEKVFVAMNSEKYSMEEVEGILEEFRALIAEPSIGNDGKVRELLKRYVKHYEK